MSNIFGGPIISGSSGVTITEGVTRSYVRANYIESNMEENIDMKNQYKITNVPYPISLGDAANKQYVDETIDEVSIVRNNINNDFNNNRLINISSLQITNNPLLDYEVTNKAYVDTSIDETSILRNNKPINVSSIQITDNPTSLQDATNKNYVDTTVNETSLVRNNKNNSLNGFSLANIKSIQINSDPINPLEVATKQYVDSKVIPGLNQDPTKTVLASSDLIHLIVNTSTGEISFPFATKDYVDKRVFNEFQVVTTFTNNSGVDLWVGWNLELLAGMTSAAGFFKAATNVSTPSTGTGPDGNPPIGTYYAFIETSTPNNGLDRYAIATYNQHTNITRISFWYHRKGTQMCRFRLQYQNLDNEWVDKVVFNSNSNLTNQWVLLDETFLEDNLGIRFYFDEILGFESDMAFSDITIDYHVLK